eukprot:augustus_masked-scaffold_43-processed-gene-1.13-mRNA-1 protein AED:1.00 eAED:1.00 QI:0/0/0/0/1/1/2/0/590
MRQHNIAQVFDPLLVSNLGASSASAVPVDDVDLESILSEETLQGEVVRAKVKPRKKRLRIFPFNKTKKEKSKVLASEVPEAHILERQKPEPSAFAQDFYNSTAPGEEQDPTFRQTSFVEDFYGNQGVTFDTFNHRDDQGLGTNRERTVFNEILGEFVPESLDEYLTNEYIMNELRQNEANNPPPLPPRPSNTEGNQDSTLSENELDEFEEIEVQVVRPGEVTAQNVTEVHAVILNNILSFPSNDKYHSINLSNAKIQNIFDESRDLLNLLKKIGFKFLDGDRPKFGLEEEPSDKTLRKVYQAYEALKKFGIRKLDAKPYDLFNGDIDAGFDPTKPIIHSMNMNHTNALKKAKSRTSDLPSLKEVEKRRKKILIDEGIPERNFILAKEAKVLASYTRNIEDSISLSDFDSRERIRYKKIAEEKAFVSVEEKRVRELLKKPIYTRTKLRFCFPDGSVVEGTFSPIEQVNEVVEQLNQLLSRNVREYMEDHGVHLYLRKLNSSKACPTSTTLQELGLSRHAKIDVRFSDGGKVLREEIKGKRATLFSRKYENRMIWEKKAELFDKDELERINRLLKKSKLSSDHILHLEKLIQ